MPISSFIIYKDNDLYLEEDNEAEWLIFRKHRGSKILPHFYLWPRIDIVNAKHTN